MYMSFWRLAILDSEDSIQSFTEEESYTYTVKEANAPRNLQS